MTSAGQSARDTLRLRGQTTIAWAVFDPAWYLATYADTCGELDGADDTAALQFYLSQGQQRGHSPNLWFDEAWHMQRYPGAAAAVREGHAASAFDAYCRAGFRTRSPHWLFSELLYRQRHRDLGDEVLARDGNINGYDHYLKHGAREGRIGHLLFEPQVYQAQLATADRAEADTAGCYQHYLARIAQRLPEIRTSYCFDSVWYLRRYPAVAESKWRCALHHYLTNETPTEFDPLPEFSEAYYLQRNKDVAAAVEARDRRNGYDHFLHNGAAELRSPCAAIDLRHYVGANPGVRSEIEAGRARDAFVHYLTVGRERGLPTVPVPDDLVTERQAAALYRRRAEQLLPFASRTTVDFHCDGPPIISAIIVVRDAFAVTLWMLAALRAAFAGDMELFLIDAGATDDIRRIGAFVSGAQVLHFNSQVNVLHAVNAALSSAGADAMLFIDGTIELAPGTLRAALRRLESDPDIGAVGGKVLRTDARLESAGGIVWRDGGTSWYLRDASPLVPDANFVRDVDFLAGVLLLRAEVLNRIEGFDDAFPIEDGAVADLCLRIAEAGFRVIFDPAVAATRLTQRNADAEAAVRTQEALLRKHGDRLRFRYVADRRVEVFARDSRSGRRVLFVEDTIPLRRFGSGFVRSNDLIRLMASLGYQVTVYPIAPCEFGLATIYADMPDTIEVMHDRTLEDLADFLVARQGYYDAIWIARTHNLDRVKPVLERIIAGGKPPHVVLDTEAIVTLRDAERAALAGTVSFDVDAGLAREFANAHLCQRLVAVTAQEVRKLRELGFSNVVVIGHWREPKPTPRTFADRTGMLFLAAIHEQDSPNWDALDWFATRVLPLVEEALGWETRLTVAGYVSPTISFDGYRDHSRITFRGPVEDVEPLYNAHRIVVAPTRYAAGAPYKVHEAASFGVPVVATELLRRQLEWQDGRHLLAADSGDPAKFAQQVIAAYRDPTLWQSLRDNALDRIREDHSRLHYEMAIRRAMDP